MAARGAYEQLRQAIYSGRLGAGERIVERDLARRFRISRIPLRESLVRLQAEGLVRSVPFSSTFVEDFEPKDILEIYSLRLLFEPLAARLVANRPANAVIDRLRILCERMTQASLRANLTTLDRLDYEFHRMIVEASGHRRLLRAYDGAHIRIVSLRTGYALIKAQPPEATAKQHLKIVAKIVAQDPDGAEAVAWAHVESSIRELEKALGTTLEEISIEHPAAAPARGRVNQAIRPRRRQMD
jgi:DNA-binding GntR family transcriptional regulator